MKAFSLAPSAALVTGSTKGIGHAIALGLGAAGAEVIFHGTKRSEPLPPDSRFIPADLRLPDAPANLVAAAFREKPALDLLVYTPQEFAHLTENPTLGFWKSVAASLKRFL